MQAGIALAPFSKSGSHLTGYGTRGVRTIQRGGMITGTVTRPWHTVLAGLLLALAVALPGLAMAQPRVLSNSDRLSFTTAYDALRRGDLETARASRSPRRRAS